jgi:hypothetical protein
MPNETTPPAPPSPPTPTPTPPKPNRERGIANRAYLDEVAISRKVAAAATDPAHTGPLVAVEFDVILPPRINALADLIEADLGKLTGERAGKATMTAQEQTARDALMAVLQPIQTAAKRKFAGETQKLREAYYIATGLSSGTLDEVLTASRSVLARLSPSDGNAPPQDVLPGIAAAGKIQELADAIATYGGKDQAQGAKQTEAGKLLEAIKANVPKLAKLRRQVQLAADQAWPWRTPGVATIRKAFLLSPDRPMKD